MNTSNKEADVLDINIRIENNEFHTEVFDKRDHFGFNVVKLPDLRGNISKNCAYNVFANEVTSDDSVEKDVIESCDIQDKLIALRTQINSLITTSLPEDVISVSTAGGGVKVRLPKLELQPFDGDPLEWTPFWDTFNSSIHSNDSLSDVDKFSYLRSFVKGAAASTIAGLSVTNANYSQAIDLLKDRFGQTRVVVNAHIEALVAIPPASNALKLRRTFDESERHIRGLEALGITSETYGIMMAPILLSKIPPEVRLVVSRAHGESTWDLNTLRKELKVEIEARERSQVGELKNTRVESRPEHKMTAGSFVTATKSRSCAFCGSNHMSFECTLDVNGRWEQAKKNALCFVCLHKNHRVSKCRLKRPCTKCRGMHHISLCSGKRPERNSEENGSNPTSSENTTLNAMAEPFKPKNVCSSLLTSAQTVLMQTATVKVKGSKGWVKARLLFDSGSQRSFISQSLAKRLQLRTTKTEKLSIAVFNSTKRETANYNVADVYLRCLDNTTRCVSTVIVPRITSPLFQTSFAADFDCLRGLPLADPPSEDGENLQVEILIGLDHYWEFFEKQTMKLPSGPTAVKTPFGWVVSGMVNEPNHQGRSECSSFFIETSTNDDNQLQRFWDLESIGVCETYEKKESDVLQQFNESITFEAGRYEVEFPWKQNSCYLSDNRGLAFRRFSSLLKRLRQEKSLMKEYDTVIADQLKRGFIESVPDEEESEGVVHYIPHHAVVKRDRATTKVRVVYDASARPDNHSPSLNESLFQGPDLLGDLFGMLLRFREGKVAMIADIEKAFLQVGLKRKDRDCTRFFWVDKIDTENPKILVYRFTRVPFGVISSPFLLNATLQYHLNRSSECKVAQQLKGSLYVDNAVVSFSDDQNSAEFYVNSKELFRKAGMNLREWATNSPEAKSTIPTIDLAKEKIIKVLGLMWDYEADDLGFRALPEQATGKPLTKRDVLHYVSLIFDPLGLVSPVVVLGKIFMQTLCRHKLEWDQALTPEMCSTWSDIVQKLKEVQTIKLARHLGILEGSDFQMHAFADASLKAYAAAIYLRFRTPSGYKVVLLCSKTRVTPLKGCTLPRLEVLAVLIATRLLTYTRQQIRVNPDRLFIWSDSQIALAWIASSKPLKQFVANRVAEIRAVKAQFRYVASKDNPADLPSRGLKACDLFRNDLGWQGPSWLTDLEENWPQSKEKAEFLNNSEIQLELKASTTCAVELAVSDDVGVLGKRYSSIIKLLRVTAWCWRFIRLAKRISDRRDYLTTAEIDEAKLFWIKKVQREAFSHELSCLKREKTSQLINQLSLFLDSAGVLRCCGRLNNANISQNQKFPKLLPKGHYFTKLVIQSVHAKVLHQGLRHTLTALREEYWIPQGRQAVLKVLKACLICRRWEGKSYAAPPPPPLPPFRVTEGPAFSYTGVDFAGPLYTKDADKAWICLFTCAVTRAVHLELARNLTTQEFILCLRRFIAARGAPKKIVSDNAKTFKLAKSTLDSLWANVVVDHGVQDYVSKEGIRWVFNVERAPWWGGFFERMVGLVKRTLKKSVGKASLAFCELQTQLFEIAAVLNSRPLCFVYSSLEDGKALTPNDLSGTKGPTGFPSIEYEDEDPDYVPPGRQNAADLNKRIKHTQRVLDKFWESWRKEYLTQLREHSAVIRSHNRNGKELCRGDVVLIQDQLPRAQWKMGRVCRLIVGRDGNSRAAVVQVGKTKLQRPLQLLFPLEVPAEDH